MLTKLQCRLRGLWWRSPHKYSKRFMLGEVSSVITVNGLERITIRGSGRRGLGIAIHLEICGGVDKTQALFNVQVFGLRGQ